MNERIGIKEITWIHVSGAEMTEEQWLDGLMLCFGMLLDGRAQPTGLRQRGQDATILIVFNAYHDVVDFMLPEYGANAAWFLQLDGNFRGDQQETEGQHFQAGNVYPIEGRSMLVFVLRERASVPRADKRSAGKVKKVSME